MRLYIATGLLLMVHNIWSLVHHFHDDKVSFTDELLHGAFVILLLFSIRKLIRDHSKQVSSLKRQTSFSQRKYAEDQKFINSLLEDIPCAVTVLSPTLEMVNINKAVTDITGIKCEEAIGKKCYTVFGDGSVCVNCPVQQSLETGLVQQNVKLERTRQDKEIYIQQTAIPIINDDGSIRRVIEVIVDITERVKLEKKNALLHEQTIHALTNLIESRDKYTSDHSHKVRDIAVAIGNQLNLPPNQMQELSIAAILHDVGKIGIPEYILNKPGKLSDEEYKIIKEHPVIGYNAIKQIDQLQPVADAVLYHHEMYNGMGYPRGLKDKQIPLVARILVIADIFEAITSDRVYRKALSFGEALTIMKDGRGSYFDPEILDAFLGWLADDNHHLHGPLSENTSVGNRNSTISAKSVNRS